MKDYVSLKERMMVLLDAHTKICSPDSTETRKREEKERAISKIEEGRLQLGLDLIVKTSGGEPANEKNTPILTLYQMVKEIERVKEKERKRKRDDEN